jgi:hypothetical protein
MTIKARTITLTTTPQLIQAVQKNMLIYFEASSLDSTVRIGGSDLTSSTNGYNPLSIDAPSDSLVLERGDDLYGVVTSGTKAITYLAIGN